MAITLNGSTGIVETNIADSAITTAKIANNAVTATDLHTTAITDKLGYTPLNKLGFGYKNFTDASTSVSIPNTSTATLLGSISFTIPSTTGISTWNVIATCSWTGAQGGHRVWTYVTLDHLATGGASGSNQTSNNNDGWAEHSWAESDVSVAAFTWNQSATWTNVAAGEHVVRIYAYSINSTTTCWRRGISVIWVPNS
jgi:hypothetical protein